MRPVVRFGVVLFAAAAFLAPAAWAQDEDQEEDGEDLIVYLYDNDQTCDAEYYEGFEDGYAEGYVQGQSDFADEQAAEENQNQNQNQQNKAEEQQRRNVEAVAIKFEEGSECIVANFQDEEDNQNNNNNDNNNNQDGDQQDDGYFFRIIINDSGRLQALVYSSQEGCEYEAEVQRQEIEAEQQADQNGDQGNNQGNDQNNNNQGNNDQNNDQNNNQNNNQNNQKQDDDQNQAPEFTYLYQNEIFCDECTEIADSYYISTACITSQAQTAGEGGSSTNQSRGSSDSEDEKKYTASDMAVGVILAAAGVGLLVAAVVGCRSKKEPSLLAKSSRRSYVKDDDEV